MARISRYPQDNLVEGTDKLIGTNEDGDVTKTYTLTSLGEWLKYNTQPIATLTSVNGTQFIVAAANDGTIQGIPLDSVAPNITSLPVITGTLNVAETLTATPGAFTGLPEPTTVLQWQRSDDGLTEWADIAGATGTTYLLGSLDEDKYIRVQQTEENILGTATANSVSTTQVGPALFVGLLDEYPNAAVAYSLRKLKNFYSGSAIKVRRGSDQELQDIGFLANGELDTATLESFCSGTDGFVTIWYDQSGNGNDMAQTISSHQPRIVTAGSIILDTGKPSIDFADGQREMFSNGVSNYNQPNTYFIKANAIFNSSDFTDGGAGFRNLNDYANGKHRMFANLSFQSTFNYVFGEQFLRYSLFDGSNSEMSINGAAVQTGDVGTSPMYGAFQIGDSSSDFKLNEFIMYNSDKRGVRTGIETNINNFYNIY